MFNPFKKKSSNPDLINFQNSFSEEQKAAMIYSLMLMMASEGSYDSKKFDYITKQAELLNIDLEGKSMSVFHNKNADHAYPIIRNLSESQKEFYSVMLGNIAYINGNPTENEIRLTNIILSETDISHEKFKNSISKAQALLSKFNR